MIHVVLRRAEFISNILLLLNAVPVTVMLQQQQKENDPIPFFPTFFTSCPPHVQKAIFCTFSNAGKLVQMFFSSHIML